MQKNNEIISNFYLIREDDNPIYVGYTNRDVKQRFKEHINEKDFTGDASVEELDSLYFPFTWDINTINQYAKQVSDREISLITEYGTSSSIWQKGVNGNIGGQTWADIKHFVSINRNNPKFAGVEEADVVELINYQKKIKQGMYNVISSTMPVETRGLKEVIGNTQPAEHIRLQHVIGNTIPKEVKRLKDVIGTTKHKEHIRLQNVIGITKHKEHIRLQNVIRHTIPIDTQRLQNVIGNTQPAEHKKLKHVIGNTIPKEAKRLQNVISMTRVKKLRRKIHYDKYTTTSN